MDAQVFKQLIDAYGADPARWPDDRRDAALAWQADNHAQAEVWIREAAVLDQLLSEVTAPTPSELLQARILAKVPRPVFDNWRSAAAAAAITLIVGLAGGYAGGGLILSPDLSADEDAYYAEAFGGLSADWDFAAGDGA
ncbi:hypothetical protein [Hyphobacterium marinum]|uniref:Uncharacterized protein n=1 Tax=Hyphobacterium marinum TaxID=3116574 RepID=A0ABU7M0G9_9PROT|nr:hypothetical protein [Hyphobacterium sp. Y6023]MEE2567303.1 hypothetical protein [Hyphobacterium sp. Y6023]